jgi:hypothetical protein
MVDRKEVQAGDDALDDGAPPADGQPTVDTMGLSAEEFAQFQEMQANSGPDAKIVPEGETEADGLNADAAAAAAAAAAAPAAGADGAPPATPPAEGEADDDGDDEVDPTQGGKFPQRVSYHKFKRTDDRLKAATTQLKEANEKLARTDERIKMLVAAVAPTMQQQPPKAAEPDPNELGPMPDPEQDIFAFAKWQAKKNEMLEQHLMAVTENVIGTQEDQQLKNAYLSDIQTFAASTPDFRNAYEHMMLTRVAELAMQQFGVNLLEQGSQLTKPQYDRIAQQVEREERQLAQIAFKNGQSPSRQLYVMAMHRGYRTPEAAPAPGAAPPAAKPGNGSAAPPAPAARPSVSAAVAAARRATETNQTLSSGGGAPEGQLTSAQVMAMGNAEFDRWFSTASPEEIRAVLGQ